MPSCLSDLSAKLFPVDVPSSELLFSLAAGAVVVSVVLVSLVGVVSAEGNDVIKLVMVVTVSFKNKVPSKEDMVRFKEMNVLEFARVRRKSVVRQLVLFDYIIHRALR